MEGMNKCSFLLLCLRSSTSQRQELMLVRRIEIYTYDVKCFCVYVGCTYICAWSWNHQWIRSEGNGWRGCWRCFVVPVVEVKSRRRLLNRKWRRILTHTCLFKDTDGQDLVLGFHIFLLCLPPTTWINAIDCFTLAGSSFTC